MRGRIAGRDDVLDLVIDAVAAYRITRLVTSDTFGDRLRDAVIRWAYDDPTAEMVEQGVADRRGWQDYAHADDDPPKVAELVTCPWCAGVWVGFGVVAARRLAPGLWGPVARALAVSAVAAQIAVREP